MYENSIKRPDAAGGSVPEPESLRFWKNTRQEPLLTALVLAEQHRLQRPIEVLEVGAYDLSKGLLATVGELRFDLVLTVSALVHEPTERIPMLLEGLGQVLRPDGLLCLLENQLVPFPLKENAWNGGGWLHPYAELMPEGWDLHHGAGLLGTHDLYLLKRNGVGERRYFQFQGTETPRDERQPLTLDALRSRGLPRLRSWTEQAEQALRGTTGVNEARVAELSERLEVETERSRRRQRLLSLADELARVRAAEAPAVIRPSTSNRKEPHVPAAESVLLDSPFDTTWAHVEPRFARMMHVFHQEWFGIRAASGYAPGHKLAISADRQLTPEDMRRAVEACERLRTRAVVFQGFSPNARELMLMLRRVFGTALRLYCVWHGSTSQFHIPFELETFSKLLELRTEGLLDGVACVKPEMCLMSPVIYQQTLLNFPPRVEGARGLGKDAVRSAFIPTPNNWWKNFYSNVYVAVSSAKLDTVYVTSPFESNPQIPVRNRVVNVGHLRRPELFRLIGQAHVLLNVTLSECQPMTAVEGLAHGVACLTGPLSLGALDEHPYQKLVQVAGTGSLGQIRAAMEHVLELKERSPAELSQMMEDYSRTLRAEAINRYLEFTQL
ncbi:methyltransferase type 11 [Archangium sp.]|uniref:methyltransferase type 11 n=1 Tax=Archangium sp. TaxID=1872627 RepID=UPI002D57CD29|nr:methyltransferase type 11 [Archangium sp.]HYO58512.1 methyltransferase type 11 [Archangium sp.]